MKDRFKFRAWNKQAKEMEYNLKYPCIEGCTLEDGFETFEMCGGEIMQCTGLKDKNGKLIFEGDIVQCWNSDELLNDEEGCIAAVTWKHCRFVVIDNTCNENEFLQDLDIIEEVKIIGNIYQTPELLEDLKTNQ